MTVRLPFQSCPHQAMTLLLTNYWAIEVRLLEAMAVLYKPQTTMSPHPCLYRQRPTDHKQAAPRQIRSTADDGT